MKLIKKIELLNLLIILFSILLIIGILLKIFILTFLLAFIYYLQFSLTKTKKLLQESNFELYWIYYLIDSHTINNVRFEDFFMNFESRYNSKKFHEMSIIWNKRKTK